MPASEGAFGQMSSLVARLYLGPGRTGMVTAGQAGAAEARGPSVQFPRWAVLSDTSTCPSGLSLSWNS